MATSSIGSYFTVSAVDFSIDVDTRVNIKKRKERINYRTLGNQDRINLSYCIGEQTTPANNLVISDRSVSLTQNRIPATNVINTSTTSALTLNVDKFLVTDVFTEDLPTKEPVPLFYVHTLSNYNPTNDDWDDGVNKRLLSVEFADSDLAPLTVNDSYTDSTTGEVFNNVKNTYNDHTGDFDVTYIKYTVRTVSGGLQHVTVYHELVNNTTVFSEATFDDIDDFGGIIAGHKRYLIEPAPGGSQFLVTLPAAARYAYMETPESRIKLLQPNALDLTTPWYVKVSNGKFIASLRVDLTTYRSHLYSIAEFDAQTFNPFPPYKFHPNQKAIWLNKTLIKVPGNIVLDSTLELFVDILVLDKDNARKAVYSNNPTKIGTIYAVGFVYEDQILSIDEFSGFIELGEQLRDDDKIYVSYYSVEEDYEFTVIDFNPVNNLDTLTNRVVLYTIPETSSTGELSATLYYLTVNSLGEILYSSQAVTGGADPGSIRLQNEDFYNDGTPRYSFLYDSPSTASGLLYSVSGIYSDFAGELSFIDKYTVESVLLSNATASGDLVDGRLYNFRNNPRFLVLGDISVGESQNIEDLSLFDIRVRGGGIKPDKVEESLIAQDEVSWYADIGHGKPYPSGGAFYIEIPKTILTTYGGSYTEDQVREIVSRHMRAGGYPVIHYYGIDPVIISTTTGSGLIGFSWPSYGANVEYNVYYSPNRDSGFSLWNGSPIPNNSLGNSDTIDGLNLNTTYYVYITAIDSNGVETEGPTVGIMTSATNA